MLNCPNESFDELERQLRSAADATRPAFSPQLHERILAAIDDCEMLPQRWTSRYRRPLVLAASLLAIVAGGLLAGSSLVGGRGWLNTPSGGSSTPPVNALAAHDRALMERALAAADHWGWLDEDARNAAWFVADLPLDQDWQDAVTTDDDEEAEVGG